MKILVTGGGGFIGSHLVDSLLAQGFSVRVSDLDFGRLSHALEHPNLETVPGDIRDQGLAAKIMGGIDLVYHLAAAHLDASLSRDTYHEINVEASLALLKEARRQAVARFLHCSSVGVMGNNRGLADEKSPCQPTNIYEQTKLEGERVALEFASETGFPIVVARPAWVYGPRCPRTQKLFGAIRARRFIFFGDGRNLRHPIFIADAIEGLQKCAQVGKPGETYILAGPRPVTLEELVHAIAELEAVSPPPGIHLPIVLGRVLGLTLEGFFKVRGKNPPFSRRSMSFFQNQNAYSTLKAARELGFCPRFSLKQGLRRTKES